jgi:hypothetical protein
MVLIRGDAIVKVIIQDGRVSGAFRTREREGNWRGRRKNGRSRRWCVVGFKDNALIV